MKRRVGLLLGWLLDAGEVALELWGAHRDAKRYGARARVEEADGPLRATPEAQRAHEAWRRSLDA